MDRRPHIGGIGGTVLFPIRETVCADLDDLIYLFCLRTRIALIPLKVKKHVTHRKDFNGIPSFCQ